MFQKALVGYVEFKVGNMTIMLGLDTDERKQQRTLHLTFKLEQEHVKKSVVYLFDVDELCKIIKRRKQLMAKRVGGS